MKVMIASLPLLFACALVGQNAGSPQAGTSALSSPTKTRILGHIIDGLTSHSIGHAAISLTRDGEETARQTKSDDDGAFAFDDVDPGDYQVSAVKAGFTAMIGGTVFAP